MAKQTKVLEEKLVTITPPDTEKLSWWDWAKYKSGWSQAGSIFVARVEAFSGFLVGVLGGLDWPSLMALDFTNGINKGTMIFGGLWFVKGIVSEVVRRNGATDLK